MSLLEKTRQLFDRIEKEYAPRVIGRRLVSGPEFIKDRWTRDLRSILEADAPEFDNNGPALITQWAQGAPQDRAGVIAIFHPATTAIYQDAAEAAAKTYARPVYLIKMRDARWVYLFAHDAQAGCGDEDCTDCERCREWISSDWEYKIYPDGTWETISLS